MSNPPRTAWRLEPLTQGLDDNVALQARVLDPLWMLCRQWQMGEMRAEDAGTPAHVQLRVETTPLTRWATPRGGLRARSPGAPLEADGTAEAGAAQDLETAAALGRLFDELLAEQGLDRAAIAALRKSKLFVKHRIDRGLQGDASAEGRLRRLLGGKCWDGLSLLRSFGGDRAAGSVELLRSLEAQPSAFTAALQQLELHAERAYGRVVQNRPPPGWDPATLDQELRVATAGEAVLEARPDDQGDFDWYAFDQAAPPAGEVWKSREHAAIPGRVRFAGMPNVRWWDFEDASQRLVALDAEAEDLSRILFLDYLLIGGNDWFVLPIDVELGSLVRVAAGSFFVTDVFGVRTAVTRAEAQSDGGRFAMFRTAVAGARALKPELADYLVVPPSWADRHVQGPVLEEVAFGRDEMANLAWAVERILPDGTGRPRSRGGKDRSADAPLARGDGKSWRYRVQTEVPPGWIPFVPTPAGDAEGGQMALQRAALWSHGRVERADPDGRILYATGADQPYRLREEALPRAGVRVQRRVVRARGLDGEVHTWVQWFRQIGRGELSSGLRYDVLEPDR